MADLDQLNKDFNDHRVEDAKFRAETSAYIKDAAQDIKDIKVSFDASKTAQWEALTALKEGLSTETTERKVANTELKGNIRMAGYTKIIAILASLTLMVVGSYLVMFRGI